MIEVIGTVNSRFGPADARAGDDDGVGGRFFSGSGVRRLIGRCLVLRESGLYQRDGKAKRTSAGKQMP